MRALQSSATRVWDLVLKRSDEMSLPAMSLSLAMDQVKGHINTMAANGFHWVAQLALVAALVHFHELDSELELLGFWCNVDLIEGQLHAL
jgi:hypothetical protein